MPDSSSSALNKFKSPIKRRLKKQFVKCFRCSVFFIIVHVKTLIGSSIAGRRSAFELLWTLPISFGSARDQKGANTGSPPEIFKRSLPDRIRTPTHSALDFQVHSDLLRVRKSPLGSAGRVYCNLKLISSKVHRGFKFTCNVCSKSTSDRT